MSDTRATEAGTAPLFSLIAKAQPGTLNNKKVVQWKKPLFIALIILGIVGLGAAGVGFAAFGANQNWWALGGLSNLGSINSIILMSGGAVGGILLYGGGIIGLVKTRQKKIVPVKAIEHPITSLSVKGAVTGLDTTYVRKDDEGILDIVYCSKELGFGCIVDGTGHSNPRMQGPLTERFDSFISQYMEGLSDKSSTLEEISQYFESSVRDLEEQFRNQKLTKNRTKVNPVEKDKDCDLDPMLGTFLDSTYQPAMSFVQLVQLDNQLILLTAQAGDTIVVVEMKDGSLVKTQPQRGSCGVGHLDKVKIQSFNITGAQRIIGFSDGLGEFMTFDDLKEALAGTASEDLFETLTGVATTPKERDESEDNRVIAANGANLKPYDKTDLKRSDDIGLFVMDI